MSYEVERNLKKKYLQEAFDDIESHLVTDAARRMFKGLMDMATKHALAERKKREEVNTQQAIDNGIMDAETIDA